MVRRLFGSIRKRNGRYLGQYRVQGIAYYTPTRRTKKEVSIDLDKIRASIDAGTWISPEQDAENKTRATTTLKIWYNTWIPLVEQAGYSPNTLRSYRSHWRAHVLPRLGENTLLTDLTTAKIEEFLQDVRAHTSQTTAGNVARSLSAGLSAAHSHGRLEKVPEFPPGWMKRTKARGGKTITYTAKQLNDLIAAADPKYRAAIALGSYGCLRSSEVAGLRRDDIGIGGKTVRVDEATKTGPGGHPIIGPPKSEAGYRTISLPPEAARIVCDHLEKYVPPAPRSLLFTTRTGGYERSRVFLAAYKTACMKTGLPVGRFHDLRHSGLTLYGQAGATLAELMARAGHSDVGAVLIYQHAGVERDAELATRMASR